jgi:hypothetical protein
MMMSETSWSKIDLNYRPSCYWKNFDSLGQEIVGEVNEYIEGEYGEWVSVQALELIKRRLFDELEIFLSDHIHHSLNQFSDSGLHSLAEVVSITLWTDFPGTHSVIAKPTTAGILYRLVMEGYQRDLYINQEEPWLPITLGEVIEFANAGFDQEPWTWTGEDPDDPDSIPVISVSSEFYPQLATYFDLRMAENRDLLHLEQAEARFRRAAEE